MAIKRFYFLVPALLLTLTAWNLGAPVATMAPTNGGAPAEGGTIVAATSSIPTSTAPATGGNALPVGTLILTQLGKPVAQLPNRQTISLSDERFGPQAS